MGRGNTRTSRRSEGRGRTMSEAGEREREEERERARSATFSRLERTVLSQGGRLLSDWASVGECMGASMFIRGHDGMNQQEDWTEGG